MSPLRRKSKKAEAEDEAPDGVADPAVPEAAAGEQGWTPVAEPAPEQSVFSSEAEASPAPDAADDASVDANAAAAFAAAGEAPPPMGDAPPLGDPGASWGDSLSASGEPLTERPEALVGAAFAGGVLAALILKRLAR